MTKKSCCSATKMNRLWAMKTMNCLVKEMKNIPGKPERNFLIEMELPFSSRVEKTRTYLPVGARSLQELVPGVLNLCFLCGLEFQFVV